MSKTERRPAGNRTLLVADDDSQVVTSLSQCLCDAGFAVLEARDAASALELCVSRAPDLAILDYQLACGGGGELARHLASAPGIPIIFLSDQLGAQMVQDAIAAGALAFLLKPVDTQQLHAAVRTALQRGQELRDLRRQTTNLDTALQAGRTVSVAVGLLMGKFQIDQTSAFESLRRHARSSRRRLEDVATELLRSGDESARLLASIQLATDKSAAESPTE